MVNVFRLFPPLLRRHRRHARGRHGHHGPVVPRPAQAVKLGRLVAPTIAGHAPAALAAARARRRRSCAAAAPRRCSTRSARSGSRCSRSTATATSPCRSPRPRTPPAAPAATSSSCKGGSHSWLLKDPETLPGDHARAHAGPARHRRPEGRLERGSTPSTPPTTRSRRPSTTPTPSSWSSRPASGSTTPRTCTARPATTGRSTPPAPRATDPFNVFFVHESARMASEIRCTDFFVVFFSPHSSATSCSRRSASWARAASRRVGMCPVGNSPSTGV